MADRKYTSMLLGLIDDEMLDKDRVISCFVSWCGEESVKEMIEANKLIQDAGYYCDSCGKTTLYDEDHPFDDYRYCESCFKLVARPEHGRCWYDLSPKSSELWVLEGPMDEEYLLHADMDTDELPEGFHWVTDDQWEFFNKTMPVVDIFEDGCTYHGFHKVVGTKSLRQGGVECTNSPSK